MKANRYGNTPNKDIPLNDRKPGEIADIAWAQLRKFQCAADTWPVHHTLRDNRYCNVCRLCKQNLWFSSDEDNGAAFTYTEADIKALIVAHIRQRHTNDNGEIDEVSGECEILDGASSAYASGFRHGPPGRPVN